MRMLKTLTIALFLLSCLSCSRSPQDARKELGQMNVEYSPNSFLKSIRNGDAVAVKLFIEAGMPLNEEYEIDAGSKERVTPLMLALSNSSKYEIANLLLDNGADVNKYLYAEKIGSGEKVVMYTPMSVAFKNDKFDKQERKKLIMKIIDNGADVNISLMSGDSPLNWAVRESDPEIVRAMIKKGAKVSKGVLEDAEKVKTKPDGNEIYEMVKAASS